MTKEETRLSNVNKILDHAFGYCRDNGIDMASMDRKLLNDVMYEFSSAAGMPANHHLNAFHHAVAVQNNIPSKFLEPISNQKNTIMKKKAILPMMPIQFFEKDERDEPTIKTRSKAVEPYISPLNFQK